MENPTPSSTQDLSRIISPKSIAVIGASRKAGSVGEAIFKNLLKGDYKGILYPVNPKADSIAGVKAYATLSHIREPIDLAIIIVPAKHVPSVLEECAAANIPGAVVISAGFKEVGGEGAELEKQIKELAEKKGIALMGPNCLGLINTDPTVMMNASFAKEMPKPGNIAFVSQSGALCTAVLDYAKGEGIGFSKFISLGNKAVTNELDFLQALRDDPLTQVILLYVEDITDGRDFIRLTRQITKTIPNPKPIIAIKSGRTKEGAKAASSHTGSLAGSDEVYDAVFMQSGVMRVETVQELFDYALSFSQQPYPKGNRIAIVTNAGGPGIMATDAAIRHGLKLAEFDEQTKATLKKNLPATASINNPVDVIGDARHDRFETAVRAVLKDPNVDGIVVILTPQAMTDIEEIGDVVANVAHSMRVAPWTAKPLLASFMGVVDVSVGVERLEKAGIPHYVFPEAAVRALAMMHRYKNDWLNLPKENLPHYAVQKGEVQNVLDKAKSDNRNYLPETESLAIFKAYGLPTLKSRLAKTEEEAMSFATEMGFPVAMKIVSPKIVHKLDAGGVELNIKNKDMISKIFRKMMFTAEAQVNKNDIWGIEIQEMADKGTEVFIGAKRDPNFGPVVVFGLGGTFVEVFRDVAFRVAPLSDHDIQNMTEQIKASKLLKGYRGTPVDIDKIVECLGRVSQLVMDFPQIQELDINPLIVYPKGNGARAADGRILLS